MSSDRLNVIGLISGGKDSFYSLLHCIEHGHKVVALANLFPSPDDDGARETQVFLPGDKSEADTQVDNQESDLNSFMYQTVGHEVIPLYAAATGLPLYRQPIRGGAVRHERDYDYAALQDENDDSEETESMIPLLRTIMREHPEANAICAGAILSTYQRTRVESIALRLGLTPLAYLWKYPILPAPSQPAEDAQLLLDMAAVGLDARIIKVASAGLDDEHLWLKASSREGVQKIKKALRMFGAAQGASLGEGGEFETLVVDGPSALFNSRISVSDDDMTIMKEGGGTAWVKLSGARLASKEAESKAENAKVRQPVLWDAKFDKILNSLASVSEEAQTFTSLKDDGKLRRPESFLSDAREPHRITVIPHQAAHGLPIQSQTIDVVEQVKTLLFTDTLEAHAVSNTLIVLRKMADFPRVNAEYAKLFPRANPPSRVTISCGDLLPHGVDIMLSLSSPRTSHGRRGLHVQGRSYWAPANIGPYSQAIDTPLSSDGDSRVRCVTIAGQIPLIPATMVFPESSKASLHQQITLSLQHLWRIGTDLKVQFWSSAVAYFSRSEREDDMRKRAILAGSAWKQANIPSEDEEDGNELDPWDLKHNAEFMTHGDVKEATPTMLPHWDALPLSQQNDWEPCVPPFFAVEVQELPRQAEVEWHAHIGIGGAEDGDIEMFSQRDMIGTGWSAWHMIVRDGDNLFLHTTLARIPEAETTRNELKHEMSSAYQDAVTVLGVSLTAESSVKPYMTYMDTTVESDIKAVLLSPSPEAVVPCHSIWMADGTRKSIVALYRRALRRS